MKEEEEEENSTLPYEEVVDHTKKSFEMTSNPAYPHVYYS